MVTPKPQDPPQNHPENRAIAVLKWIIATKLRVASCSVAFLLFLAILFFAHDWNKRSEVTVVASEELVGEKWKVTGFVLSSDGAAVPDATVTLIATTSRGETRTVLPQKSSQDGGFTFEGVVREMKNEATGPVNELKVTAFLKTPWHEPDRRGRQTWSVRTINHQNIRAKEISFSGWFLVPLACFLLTLCIIFFSGYTRWSHVMPCLLAILLTGSMTSIIGYCIMWINERVAPSNVASLGFLNIYRGTYVKEGAADWLVSLTSPVAPTDAPIVPPPPPGGPQGVVNVATPPVQSALATGLGAPLWVVFVSVLGSGLLTIVLVIGEVLEPLPVHSLPDIQKRFRGILEHQFFVLFSPLGGIIVYQLMLLGGAAGSPVVVAITILGAGATLNGLLTRAVKLAADWVMKANENREPAPAKSKVVIDPRDDAG